MNALIAIIPVLLLFILMLGFKVSGYKSALITLIVTACIALWIAPATGMVPEKFADDSIYSLVGWSFVEGVLKAIFPILLIILMAIYSYNVLVESKAIEVIKRQFTTLTSDKGVLVLLMVWGFGGLLEGMAGFGTAVAIPAAILIGLGFKPMFSALVSLIGNTVAIHTRAVRNPHADRQEGMDEKRHPRHLDRRHIIGSAADVCHFPRCGDACHNRVDCRHRSDNNL